MKHLSLLGKDLMEQSKETTTSINMINSETDLKIFIDENRTHQQFLEKTEFKHFEQSVDVRQ